MLRTVDFEPFPVQNKLLSDFDSYSVYSRMDHEEICNACDQEYDRRQSSFATNDDAARE